MKGEGAGVLYNNRMLFSQIKIGDTLGAAFFRHMQGSMSGLIQNIRGESLCRIRNI